MKVLVCGGTTAGSWVIRGQQLGGAAGFDVQPGNVSNGGVRRVEHDVVVMVKRPDSALIREVHRAGALLVWDMVDCWPQPPGNQWDRDHCLAWLRSVLRSVEPDLVIAATRAMSNDVQALGWRATHVYHHGRERPRATIRPTVAHVGYEGGAQYISRWRFAIEDECRKRGWVFHVNPPGYSGMDIILGVRDDNGYAPRHWKSNVKLANAQIVGLPFVGSPERGYTETGVGNCEKYVESEKDLARAFDALVSPAERKRIGEWSLSVAPTLAQVTEKYREAVLSCKKA